MGFLSNVELDKLNQVEQDLWREEYDRTYKETQTWTAQAGMTLTAEELHYLTMLEKPKFWAAETLKWYARDYQEPMLQEMADSKRTVLRLGRRLGKTETMCIMILWHAFTQPNKGPNNQYDILIIAPYETQVDLIFNRLSQLIDMSGDIQPSRDIKHRIELANGTIIQGLTAGSKSGNGAANTRGQRADLIIMDECDYMGESEITNIMNIRNEAPERIKMIVASTPSGRRDSYYKWCTGATVSYAQDHEETEKKGRVTYKRTEKGYRMKSDGTPELNKQGKPIRDGNGWTTIHAPSTVNPELLKVNPDTGLTYLEELQLDLTEMRYIQEVIADFGESIDGVFLKKHIDAAIDAGKQLQVEYKTVNYPRAGYRILGVDWDKRKADTNMVGVEWNHEHKKFIPFYRKVIPRGDFTYDTAVQEIKRATQEFEFDYIMVDAGHGEYQIEKLRQWARDWKKGYEKRVIRLNLSEKVTVYDPITRKAEKHHIKPFIVNNAVLMFERGMVALNPTDRETISQFESYEVKSWGTDGRPTYTDENEHILDCIVFCIYGATKYFDDVLKITKATAIYTMKRPLDRTADPIASRDMTPETKMDTQTKRYAASLGLRPKQSSTTRRSGGRSGIRSMGVPSRKSF